MYIYVCTAGPTFFFCYRTRRASGTGTGRMAFANRRLARRLRGECWPRCSAASIRARTFISSPAAAFVIGSLISPHRVSLRCRLRSTIRLNVSVFETENYDRYGQCVSEFTLICCRCFYSWEKRSNRDADFYCHIY